MRKLNNRRFVRLLAMDRNINVPIDKSIIFIGDERFPDLSDHELMFDAKIDEVLTEYNKFRVTVKDLDRSIDSGSEVFLEPLRLKDLRILVIDEGSWETVNDG